jgi:hypothetical protein
VLLKQELGTYLIPEESTTRRFFQMPKMIASEELTFCDGQLISLEN